LFGILLRKNLFFIQKTNYILIIFYRLICTFGLLSLANSRALNALFNGVDKNMFRLIKKCDVAKDVWDILKTAHEGTAKVKRSRLQLLTTQFEKITMKEDESIQEF
jgi:hypothetical protein